MARFEAIAFLISCLLGALAWRGSADAVDSPAPDKRDSYDVLVFAPHPDDEVLGCAGVIMQALAAGKRVGVVVFTNGDGYPRAASVITKKKQDALTKDDFAALGAERQGQSLEAAKRLGLPPGNVIFLGYPDSELANLYRAESKQPLRQKFTKRDHTYGVVVSDYHLQAHGSPAPYAKAAILADVGEILEKFKPKEIYVTHEVDKHADHKATFWFVRDAARAVGSRGKFYTYVVHGDERPELPLRRVALTAGQVEAKRHAIQAHQIPTVHDALVEYAKAEELFWELAGDDPAKRKNP